MQSHDHPQATGQDLAKLALNAAKELDRLSRGEEVAISYAREVARCLETESGINRNDGSASYLSPTKVEIIYDSTSGRTGDYQNFSADIQSQFTKIISDLRTVSASSEPDQLARLVEFLVKFHDVLYSRQRNIHSARRPNSRFRV